MRSVIRPLPDDSRAAGRPAAAAAVLTALASPAEARRGRHHHHVRAGGGYNPPYAAMVVDVKSGKTLHAVNEDALRHPASITKVMTLYLLFEQMERGKFALDSELTISAHAAAQAPSKLGLRPGQTIAVEDAIKAIVTKSANDVACAIGENIAGSEERFAEMMTAKAHALGMSRTHYANASGLPDPDQLTTARDLTVLARAIQDRFPHYYRYFQTRSFAFRGRVIGNHNHLLGNVEGVDGIKTGYTRDSGFNLMTAAKSEGRQIVAIVLGGKSGASRDRIMADLVRVEPAAGLCRRPACRRRSPRSPSAPARRWSPTRSRGPARRSPRPTTRTSRPPAPPASPSTSRQGRRFDHDPGRAPGSPARRACRRPRRPMPAPAAPSRLSRARRKSDAPASPSTERDEPPKAVSGARVVPTAWVIQLGAMDDEGKARAMLSEARAKVGGSLSKAAPYTVKVEHGGTTLFRARFSGFAEQDSAQDACSALKRSGFSCFATRS